MYLTIKEGKKELHGHSLVGAAIILHSEGIIALDGIDALFDWMKNIEIDDPFIEGEKRVLDSQALPDYLKSTYGIEIIDVSNAVVKFSDTVSRLDEIENFDLSEYDFSAEESAFVYSGERAKTAEELKQIQIVKNQRSSRMSEFDGRIMQNMREKAAGVSPTLSDSQIKAINEYLTQLCDLDAIVGNDPFNPQWPQKPDSIANL